jgi:hypothetical protein
MLLLINTTASWNIHGILTAAVAAPDDVDEDYGIDNDNSWLAHS